MCVPEPVLSSPSPLGWVEVNGSELKTIIRRRRPPSPRIKRDSFKKIKSV